MQGIRKNQNGDLLKLLGTLCRGFLNGRRREHPKEGVKKEK